MPEPRIKINQLREKVIFAAYDWRSNDVHHSACVLGLRQSDTLQAFDDQQRALTHLAIAIDNLHQEEKSLGLV